MKRSGFVAIVGRPNTGKSTLTNALVGTKVAITSSKPQTTRHTIRGIVNTEDAQIVLVDTPGIHRPRTLLGERLNELVRAAYADVEVIAMCLPDQAMEYLPWGNRQGLGELEGEPAINVAGKNVVIIGGGDTGADCLGTALRQGAASITQLEILPRPSDERPSAQPWPMYPMIFRTSSAHEEGGERIFAVNTSEFMGDQGVLTGLKISEVELTDGKFENLPGTDRVLPADFVLLAMGFVGPEKSELIAQLEVELDERGNISRADDYSTNVPGIFVCGDAGRGQSLIVWAIAEGRAAAAGVDHFLTGRTLLPVPISPSARPLTI